MKLTLTARHLEVTPNLRRYVDDKIKKLDKFNDHILEGEIILSKDHVNDIAEGKVHLRHVVIAAKGEATDLYGAVSDLIDKLVVQLRRHEGKLRDRRKSAAPRTS